MQFVLEIIGFTIQGCIAAQEAGAQRIELCDNSGEGGTTPSYGFIEQARKALQVQLYPIIRPRGGDFLYNVAELDMMKRDIIACKKLGCDGIVTGVLQANGRVDKASCSQLLALAYPMGATFHRAIDRTRDIAEAMEDIIDCGFERILSSGGYPTATEGAAMLRHMMGQAADRIIIMPGSGVKASNIAAIAAATGAVEFHSSARMQVPSGMLHTNPQMREHLQAYTVNDLEVQEMKDILAAL